MTGPNVPTTPVGPLPDHGGYYSFGSVGTLVFATQGVHHEAFPLGGEGQLAFETHAVWPVTPSNTDVWADHVAKHKCGMHPFSVGEADVAPHAVGGWFGVPMDQPSDHQYRTTNHPFVNTRQRHPTNPHKPMNIITWQEQNPDTWPDGNPVNPPARRASKPLPDLLERVLPQEDQNGNRQEQGGDTAQVNGEPDSTAT
jgi:hypothetical protein